MIHTDQRTCVLAGLLALLAVVLAPPVGAHAKAGALDRSFGDRGSFERWTDTGPWVSPRRSWPGGAGRTVIEAGGLRRLDARGRIDLAFGAGGVAPSTDGNTTVTRVPGGRWILGRPAPDADLQVLDLDGHREPGSDAFAATIRGLTGKDHWNDELIGLNDRTVLDVSARWGKPWTITKVALDGRVLGATPVSLLVEGSGPSASVASGEGAVVATAGGLVRLHADGAQDLAWGSRNGHAVPVRGYLQRLVPWDRGGVVMLTDHYGAGRADLTWVDHRGRTVRRRALASRAPGSEWAFDYALATDPQGRTLVARAFDGRSAMSVTRLRRDGRLDRAFGRRGVVHLRAGHAVNATSLTVQPDGRIIVVGALTTWGPIWHDREDFPRPDWAAHGTVAWRLRAR